MIVRPCNSDVMLSAIVGIRRHTYAMHNGQKDYGHVDDDGKWDIDILAAMAECVVARESNQYWPAHVGKTEEADVGYCTEVRLRRIPGTGTELAIRPHDKDDRLYVLVHGHPDCRFDLRGWLWGREAKAVAKARGTWCEPKGCWFVPPPYQPIESFLEMFKGRAA